MKQFHDGLLGTTITLMLALLVHTHAERRAEQDRAMTLIDCNQVCWMAKVAGM